MRSSSSCLFGFDGAQISPSKPRPITTPELGEIAHDMNTPLQIRGEFDNDDALNDSLNGSQFESSMNPIATPNSSIPISLKELQEENAALKKQNFNMKLRIFYLEESLRKSHPLNTEDVIRNAVDFPIIIEMKDHELEQRNQLLVKARNAIEKLQAELESANSRLQNDSIRTPSNPNKQLEEDRIEHLESLLEQTTRELHRYQAEKAELQLQIKENELQHKQHQQHSTHETSLLREQCRQLSASLDLKKDEFDEFTIKTQARDLEQQKRNMETRKMLASVHQFFDANGIQFRDLTENVQSRLHLQSAKLMTLQNQLRVLGLHQVMLQQELKHSKLQCTSQQSKIDELYNANLRYQVEARETRSTTVLLQDQNQQLESQIRQLQCQNQQQQQQQHSQEQLQLQQIEQLNERVRKLDSHHTVERSRMSGDLEEARQRVSRLADTNQQLAKELEQYRDMMSELEKRLTNTKEDNHQMKKQLSTRDKELKAMKDELASKVAALLSHLSSDRDRISEKDLLHFGEILNTKIKLFSLQLEKYLCYDKELMKRIHELFQKTSLLVMDSVLKKDTSSRTLPFSNISNTLRSSSQPPDPLISSPVSEVVQNIVQKNELIMRELISWSLCRDSDFGQLKSILDEMGAECNKQLDRFRMRISPPTSVSTTQPPISAH